MRLDNENQWSDLLAVLIEADPRSAASILGLGDGSGIVSVRREVGVARSDRVDLVVYVDGKLRSVVEVKVLSGLSPKQLSRYRTAFPDADHYILIFPARLRVGLADEPDWRGMTWEAVLGAFAASDQPWVAETARAWLTHLDAAMPKVSAATRWNDLTPGEDFVIALRARMSWIFGELDPSAPMLSDLAQSSAGVSWVVKLYLPAAVPGYKVVVEAEERLPVREWPKLASIAAKSPRGPSIKVCLVQMNVDTSANFDWSYLLRLWQEMALARTDWATASARPRAPHDKAAWKLMVDGGAPRYLGIGFGERQTKRSRECMFGARFQLPADVKLTDVVRTLQESVPLLLKLAATA